MTQSILNGFLIFSIIQAFLFAALFVTKKKKASADLIITLLLLLFAAHTFLILINLNNNYGSLLKIIPVTLTLLYGPLLLIYINTLRSASLKKRGNMFWHLVPFVTIFVMTFFFSDKTYFPKVVSVLGAFSGLLYCLLSFFSIRKYEERLVNLFSTTQNVTLNWLNKLVKGIVFIWAGVFILIVFKQIFQISIQLNWFFILVPLFITYIGYHGLKQQVVFQFAQTNRNKEETELKKVPSANKGANKIDAKYEKSGLLKQDMESIFGTLEVLMKTDKLYLEPNLNLHDLARKAKVPQHHITQTLNSFAKRNFYDYVNSYRVNEFIQKIKNGDADNFSLLGIAFECGFNSKSSFNRILKKLTGLSPSEHKKQPS